MPYNNYLLYYFNRNKGINYVNGKLVHKDAKKRERKGTLTKSDKALLKYTTDDRERNLDIALEKLAEEVKNGER